MNDHDWIIGVCKDLRAYAEKNGLDHVSSAVTGALNAAIWEIGGVHDKPRAMNSERITSVIAPPSDISSRKRCGNVIHIRRH